MNYTAFASIYDTLMQEAPYDEWIEYVKRCAEAKTLEGKSILDVGCGTGELLVRLHHEGAHVSGVDLSSDMLAIAREKCLAHQFEPLLIEESMANLGELGTFDIITIFCDALNYLESEEEVKATFQNMYRMLDDGGLLLFDVHSVYKVEELFIGNTFAEELESISYIWQSFAGEEEASVEHELSFFVREGDGRYRKFEELHKQRTYPIERYSSWLEEVGFHIVSITADFSNKAPTSQSERIFFCAKNKGIYKTIAN